MKIYLDNCSLQRPFDDLSQERIRGEAEAVIGILSSCEMGGADLISSEVLEAEIVRIADVERKEALLQILTIASLKVVADGAIEQRARELESLGLKAFDAFHFASAEAGKAEYFCTSDDKLLRKVRTLPGTEVKAVTPRELVEELL